MSRHNGRKVTMPDLLTGSIPVNAESQHQRLATRLVELTAELQAWQELNMKWGHINYLIQGVNDTYAQLGLDESVPEGVY